MFERCNYFSTKQQFCLSIVKENSRFKTNLRILTWRPALQKKSIYCWIEHKSFRHTPIFGKLSELRKPSSEKLYFGQRGFFLSTLVAFAELFLQKVFLLLVKINTGATFQRFWQSKSCSILLVLSIIKKKRMRKNFISKVVLLREFLKFFWNFCQLS